jgi:hypothetical protein
MTVEKQLELLEELDSKLLGIIRSKSADYAGIDVLSNFKIVAEIIKLAKIDTTTPEGFATLMQVLKIVRIWNLKAKGANPNNESLIDSYEDMINYAKLGYLIELEKTIQPIL